MKKRRSINLLLIASLLCINYSCSVEKKLYSNGYYIKWNQSNKTMKPINSNTQPPSTDTTASITPHKDLPTLGVNEDEFSVLYTTESEIIVPQKEAISEVGKSQESVAHKPSNPNYKEVVKGVKMAKELVRNVHPEKSTQRMHGLAVAGFVLALVGWFTPVNIALVLLILGVVFAAIALARISKQPEVYKGSGLAIAAFVVALIGVLIVFAM